MREFYHKISSIIMAIVVLFSTMSFTVDSHYCGDTLVDTSVFHKVKSCGMEMQNPSTEDCNITIIDCCTDVQLVVDGQDELKISSDTLTLNQQLLVSSFFYSYTDLFEGLEKNAAPFREYAPPVFIRQIYKLDETYLI